jgi:hypothetical protein
MNKTEKAVVTAALENIYAGATKNSGEDIAKFRTRMETSAKDGCHTIMKLVESPNGNEEVIKNTILFLEQRGMLDENYAISEIITDMRQRKFTGE